MLETCSKQLAKMAYACLRKWSQQRRLLVNDLVTPLKRCLTWSNPLGGQGAKMSLQKIYTAPKLLRVGVIQPFAFMCPANLARDRRNWIFLDDLWTCCLLHTVNNCLFLGIREVRWSDNTLQHPNCRLMMLRSRSSLVRI